MEFCPETGILKQVYPSHAAQWRKYHGGMAWLFNPWTGQRRNALDVGSDPFGLLIVHPDEPIKAEPAPAPEQAPAEPVGKPDLTRCRERLRLAGEPYPKSSCEACGSKIGSARTCLGRLHAVIDHHPV